MKTASKIDFKIGTIVESSGRYYEVIKSVRIGVLEGYNFGITLKRVKKPREVK